MTTATPQRFVHPALFYRGVEEYLAGTVGFVNDALDAGEPVAVAVPGPNLQIIRAALGPTAADVEMMDMAEEGRNPGRILPQVLMAFAKRHAPGPVRMIGEPIWPGRTNTEYPACLQHEALINLAFVGQDASILCPYDARALDKDVLADAARTHPVLMDADGVRDSTRYDAAEVLRGCSVALSPPGVHPVGSRLMFNATNVYYARAYAAAQALRLGLSEERASDLQSAVAELANNSVEHGGGRGILEVWAEEGHVICQVRDTGTLLDPLVGRRPVSTMSLGGRGLLLVNRLADLVRTHAEPDSTTTRIYFRLTAPDEVRT